MVVLRATAKPNTVNVFVPGRPVVRVVGASDVVTVSNGKLFLCLLRISLVATVSKADV